MITILTFIMLLQIPFLPGCGKDPALADTLPPLQRSPVKTVALTFDDGPDSLYTPLILNILDEMQVTATFFDIGQKILKYPDIVKRAHREGHLIANHTFNHLYLPGKSFERIIRNIDRTERIIDSVCGYSAKLFRPPWGAIEQAQKDSLESLGYRIVMWDIGTTKNYDVSSIVSNIVDNVAPGKIILLHDSNEGNKLDRMVIVNALPAIIEGLRAKGYTFVTVEGILAKQP